MYILIGQQRRCGQCEDGLDNDTDGWVDSEDPACAGGGNLENDGYSGTECNDGIDNDGSLLLDFVDPSCESAFDTVEDSNAPICANGVDDDGDGWVDGDDVDCQMMHLKEDSVHSSVMTDRQRWRWI